MRDQWGVVTGIDRVNGVVGAILDDGLDLWLPEGFPYAGDPPPPLSKCWFVAIGNKLVCTSPAGEGRVVLHDDFLHVATPSVTTYLGDTPWVLRGSQGTRVQDVASLGDAQGVMRYLTNANANNFVSESKSTDALVAPTPPAAIWWSGRYAINSLTSVVSRWGLGNTATWTIGALADAVAWDYASTTSANWLLSTAATSGLTLTDTGIPADINTWHAFDLMFIPDVWAAGWIDGAGPFVSTTAIPTSTDALQPGVILLTLAAAAKRLYSDWVHVELVPEVFDPRVLDNDPARYVNDGRFA